MKKLNTFFLLLTFILVSNSNAQTQPDKETTLNYLESAFSSTLNFELKTNNGVVFEIQGIAGFCDFDFSNKYIKFCRIALIEGYCTEGYEFTEVNWAKMESIADWDGIATNSPVGVLYVKFPNNSILRSGYIRSGYNKNDCNKEGFSLYGTTQSVGYVLFPYLNQEGVRERLVKALNHLSKLEKEEQAKNDPFGN